MSSLLDHLDSNQSENDDIHLLFPKCKPRASSVGTESQSSESQSNSQQYLADNFRDQNLNHQVSGSSSSTRQTSRRHSSSGFTQQHHHHSQQLPDKLLKHSKHSSYPPLLTTSPEGSSVNISGATYISGQVSPYDNNNLNDKSHQRHHHQSDSSDNFPLTPQFNSGHYSQNSQSVKKSDHGQNSKHHHSRSKTGVRSSRHETSGAPVSGGSQRHRSTHHHHNSGRSKKHMTESSSLEPIGNSASTKSSSHRYKTRESCGAAGKSYSTLSLGSGMECEPLDEPHDHYDDFNRSSRPVGNGAGFGGNGGCLRDSRIEIAGGREIYSQNRIRAGRRLRGSSSTSSSTEMMADSSMSITASSSSSGKHQRKKSPNMQQQQQPHFTNGDIMDGDVSVWEPKHQNQKVYPDQVVQQRSGHHHHGSHRHHHHHHHHHQHHSHSHGRRHVCYSHCDHPKLLSPTEVPGNNMTVKETVFSSEVTSIEKPVEQDSKSGSKGYIYETAVSNDTVGEIIFDDIGNWREGRGGRRNSSANEAGLCIDRRKEMKRSPSGNKHQVNFFHNGGESEMHCCSLEQMEHGSGSNAPTVLLQGSPSPSTRGGNTTPSGYESDEYSGVTPVSLNMMGKGLMPNNRLIGALPIAEYEGSPKRYGLRQPTHPMPTHLDLVDVDMNTGTVTGNSGGTQDLNSATVTHVVSLISPQSKPTVPTSASSSSSSSLDNTNTNSNSSGSNRNLYGNRISPRMISPSQSMNSFAGRVPGFPQRITPVTSSLDSGSLVDSGLEKSEATDMRSDNVLEEKELVSVGNTPATHQTNNSDELRELKGGHQYYYKDGTFRSGDSDERRESSALCQGQLDGGNSDLLLTDHVNLEGEKCNPSTTNLCGNPLDEGDLGHKQYHNMVLELVDSGTVTVAAEDHHQSLQQNFISVAVAAGGDKEEQLISVPSSDEAKEGAENLISGGDYLYEFSETRKVLEEFFGGSGPSGGVGAGAAAQGLEPSMSGQGLFDELDYTLKRQTGNSYVGQRLAGESCTVEESPKKPARRGVLLLGSSEGDGADGEAASPRLISFQEITLPQLPTQKGQNPPRDLNDNDIDDSESSNTETDNLGDTEVGLQVGLSRNFTLSPETTDCDSNELESEISLDYEASQHSSSRVGVSMPAVEDGLSSGNVSDTEELQNAEQLELKKGPHHGHHHHHSQHHHHNQNQSLVTKVPHRREGHHHHHHHHHHQNHHLIEDELNFGGEEGASGPSLQATAQQSPSQTTKLPSDPNPTLLLMKKQISEIEKEIKMRASQSQKMQLQNSHNHESNHTQADVSSEQNGGSASNIPSINSNGGSSCITTNGSGLASQLVSSCPDVSSLTSPGQGSLYSQQMMTTQNQNGNCGEPLPHVVPSLQTTSSSGEKETNFDGIDIELEALDPMRPTPPPSPAPSSMITQTVNHRSSLTTVPVSKAQPINIPTVSGLPNRLQSGPSTTAPTDSNISGISPDSSSSSGSVAAAIQDIKEAIQRTKTLPRQPPTVSHVEPTSRPSPLTSAQSHADHSDTSPVWVPRQGTSYHHHRSRESGVKDPLLRKLRYDETPDDDADTDQETDRLLGQTRTEDDYGFYDEKEWKKVKNCRSLLPALNKGVSFVKSATSSVQPVGLSSSASSLNTGAINTNHGLNPTSYSTSNTIAPTSARISPAPFKQQETPQNSNNIAAANSVSNKPKKDKDGIKKKRSKEDFKNPSVLIEGVLFRARYLGSTQLVCEGQPTKATRMMQAEEAVSRIKSQEQSDQSEGEQQQRTEPEAFPNEPEKVEKEGASGGNQFEEYLYPEDDSDNESCPEEFFNKVQSPTSSARSFQAPCFGGTSPGEGTVPHFGPACGSALPGTMFRLKFIGSLEVDEEVGSGKRRRKRPKKTMVEEAVFKMKAPEGETQPSTEVDLFISTEKIMVLNTDLKEIMMDHALRTISYIADIGDLVVLMARRRPVPSDTPEDSKIARPPKMICHVFESDEAQYIAQSIGQAFQVAYMEFLKANGIEDQSFVREMDYQEVLNSQEIFGDELQMFAKKELQKEVVVPKSKGEILGVVIVESGWGSMLPTVVIANLAPAGAAARCGQLNIGDQIIAINGVSLVGLPLSTCQNYIKNTKSQTVVKLTVVPCPPVVEVKIKRPDTKYQLGFSVQNGVICSLLRGGIAERGGVRVGHRIIEINGQSVVAVPHEKIVNLLATSVGEINMKTMPTSMFRLLTGQETPLYI